MHSVGLIESLSKLIKDQRAEFNSNSDCLLSEFINRRFPDSYGRAEFFVVCIFCCCLFVNLKKKCSGESGLSV